MTVSGLPIQTHAELRMWQIVQGMEPIIEKSKDTNEVGSEESGEP
jgi:hypothetical protein